MSARHQQPGRAARLVDDAHLYLRLLSTSVRAQMQYKLSFLLMSLGAFLVTGIEFLAMAALFQRFDAIEGWTLPEVALLYGMVNLSFALAEAGSAGFDRFGEMVKAGGFDRVLLRPRATALQLAGQELTLRRVGRFAQGGLVLAWSCTRLEPGWGPGEVGLLVAGVLGGAALFYGIIVLQATLCFWTVESLEVVNTVTYGGVEAAQYPISIYRPWFRRFFLFVVPIACTNYLPALALLDRADPLGLPVVARYGGPLVGPLFLLVSLRVWRFGQRRYASTGS